MDLYMTDAEAAAVERSETFEELLEIALINANRMRQPLGVVCGPITSGGPESIQANLARFAWTIHALRANGLEIFSQMPLEKAFFRIKRSSYYRGGLHLLDTFYRPFFESCLVQTMYFIPGWERSPGACWEREQGRRLGMSVMDAPFVRS
jgi:hypothetical protein